VVSGLRFAKKKEDFPRIIFHVHTPEENNMLHKRFPGALGS